MMLTVWPLTVTLCSSLWCWSPGCRILTCSTRCCRSLLLSFSRSSSPVWKQVTISCLHHNTDGSDWNNNNDDVSQCVTRSINGLHPYLDWPWTCRWWAWFYRWEVKSDGWSKKIFMWEPEMNFNLKRKIKIFCLILIIVILQVRIPSKTDKPGGSPVRQTTTQVRNRRWHTEDTLTPGGP